MNELKLNLPKKKSTKKLFLLQQMVCALLLFSKNERNKKIGTHIKMSKRKREQNLCRDCYGYAMSGNTKQNENRDVEYKFGFKNIENKFTRKEMRESATTKYNSKNLMILELSQKLFYIKKDDANTHSGRKRKKKNEQTFYRT